MSSPANNHPVSADNICWFQTGATICGRPAVKQIRWRTAEGKMVASSYCHEHGDTYAKEATK